MKKALILALAMLGACIPPPYESELAGGPIPPPLHAREITRLADAGISTDVIQELIDQRGVRALDADDLVAIKKAGFDDAMIRKMLEAERPDVRLIRVTEVGNPYFGGYSSYSYSSWGYGISWSSHR